MKQNKSINEIRKTHSILMFDGLCNLCNSSVQFVIKRDLKKKIVFSSLQSEIAQDFLSTQNDSLKNCESVILIDKNNIYTKSSAAIKVSQSLKGLWFMMSIFIILPKPIRDYVYDVIASRRYRWFGKRTNCYIPTKEEQELFLD